MKILVLSNLYPPDAIGGYEMGSRQVVDALLARGHEVRVLTTAPRTPVPSVTHVHRTLRLTDVWDHYSFVRGTPATAHINQAESHRINAFNVHALTTAIEDFEPDVAYSWMLAGVGGLGLMGCLHHLRVPWVWHLMDDVPLILSKAADRLIPAFARVIERQFRGRYLACSRQVVDEIELGGVALNGEVEIVPNWVRGEKPCRSWERRTGPLRIVAASALIDRKFDKGIDLLIEAASLLLHRGLDRFTVDVYGNVTDPYFVSLIRKYGLGEHVHLKGSRTQAELAQIYATSDVFAFPTRHREPFGFAALEAAFAGCVPLITEVCGLSEWFVHGVHCLKAPRTSTAFADALEVVLDGSVDLAMIGRRASAVVARDFHLDVVIGKIEDALEQASRKSRAGAGTAAEAYRMALLAEKLSRVLIQESLCA